MSQNGKLEIVFDITDWKHEAMANETIIGSQQAIIDLIDNGTPTGVVAKAAVVNRELGQANGDILPVNKMLFYAGAREAVAELVRKQKCAVVVGDETYTMPAYQGRIRGDEDSNASYEPSTTGTGMSTAIKYLQSVVPGHIWNRLLVIHENGGDVKAAADELKRGIDELVARFG